MVGDRVSISDLLGQITSSTHPCFEEVLPDFNKESLDDFNYLLLVSVLYQDWTWTELSRFIKQLKQVKYRFWDLPVLFQEEILSLFESSQIPRNYPINSKVPGIVWSVGEYVRKCPEWLTQLKEPTGALKLSQNIFYFGANSTHKPKLCRLLALISFADSNRFPWNQSLKFPISKAAIQFFSKTPQADLFFSLNSIQKMDYYSKVCQSQGGMSPMDVYAKIESYIDD